MLQYEIGLSQCVINNKFKKMKNLKFFFPLHCSLDSPGFTLFKNHMTETCLLREETEKVVQNL